MALREVVCVQGHRTEVLQRGSTAPTPQCHCGQATSLSAVNRIAVGGKPSAADWAMPPDMRDALTNAEGHKREYYAIMAEAEQNGFE